MQKTDLKDFGFIRGILVAKFDGTKTKCYRKIYIVIFTGRESYTLNVSREVLKTIPDPGNDRLVFGLWKIVESKYLKSKLPKTYTLMEYIEPKSSPFLPKAIFDFESFSDPAPYYWLVGVLSRIDKFAKDKEKAIFDKFIKDRDAKAKPEAKGPHRTLSWQKSEHDEPERRTLPWLKSEHNEPED